VFLAEAMFAEAGLRPALSSTVVVRHPGFEQVSGMTTPDVVSLWDWIRRSRDAGARSLAVEVSSHALDQERIGGLFADVAVFTNLTHDHLDYHGGMAEYFAAKSRLFTRHLKPTGTAVVNGDDPHGRILAQQLGERARTFGFGDGMDWTIEDFRDGLDGMSFRIRSRAGSALELSSPLMGRVFARNLAGVAVAMLEIGLPGAVVAAASRVTVPGRCQPVRRGRLRGIVDYAHTPDALERLLEGLRPLVPGRIVTVFGCGGDRDRTKRPLMGGIAERLSDLAILTSDNPRTEDPEAILDEVAAGMVLGRHLRFVDRAEAIRAGAAEIGPEDLLVVAGKGHEDYQVVGTTKHHFDDREVLGAALSAREVRA
jgi:UDP-N-acetylmuramoyl-L-alanyl-D-glutamate--2,6-diaminopimelate ligase